MDKATKHHLTDRNIWSRGLYMLFYVIAYAVAETVLSLLVIFQFICALFTGKSNDAAQQFGANLSSYVFQILKYITFNSETRPFPFSEWPDVKPGVTPWSASVSGEDESDIMPSEAASIPQDPPSDSQKPDPSDPADGQK